MSHLRYHAESSARRFGGKPEDYYELHSFFDETKELFGDFRHRALRHHAHGIYELERKFGVTITNSAGREVPVRLVGEQHVREDCGNRIPSVQDWLCRIMPEKWMNAGYESFKEHEAAGTQEPAMADKLPTRHFCISKDRRDEWRDQQGQAMQSAIWEYCPPEFWELLEAYEDLLHHYERTAMVPALRERLKA